MDNRLKLQKVLETILGSRQVYYQPPESIKMIYPAIVYSRNNINSKFANNGIYNNKYGYKIVVIDKDPDSEIVDKVAHLPMCAFNTHYTKDNLNHDIFTIYI